MDHKREKEFNELFKAKDEINSEMHEIKNFNEKYINIALINTNWYKDYLHFIRKPKNELNSIKKYKLFNFKKLEAKYDDRDYSYLGKGGFNFPSDFVFVTEKFINLISDNFYGQVDFKSLFYKIAIGGECIIMRDFKEGNTTNMYLTIYDENKGNINNNIDFILKVYDYNDFNKVCNFIIKNNVWIFLKNINFPEEEDISDILNENGIKIGYIIRNGEMKRKDEIKSIQRMKLQDITVQNIFPKFNSILNGLCLSKYFPQLLNHFYSNNKKNKIIKAFVEYFQNWQPDKLDKIKEIFSKSIKIDIFECVFDEIFEKLDLELSNEKENKEFNGRNEQIKEFKEEYEKGSIIKRLFYCPQEIYRYCLHCEKTYYKYKYKKIILLKSIDDKKENLLFEKIFKTEEISKEEECKLCNRKDQCIIYKTFISFPMILIIVIEDDQIGKLNIKQEIKNDKGVLYELYCLIEANTNMVYYKNDYKIWLRFSDNKKEDIESKIPIILFYKLTNIINNNAINNNINNQSKNNNINNNNQNLMVNNMNNLINIILII